MRIRKHATLQLIAVGLVAAALAIGMNQSRTRENEPAGGSERMGASAAPARRDSDRPPANPGPQGVTIRRAITMTSGEWETWFEKLGTAPADRRDILDLSAELREAFENGLSPESEDALVYGEAMVALLEPES